MSADAAAAAAAPLVRSHRIVCACRVSPNKHISALYLSRTFNGRVCLPDKQRRKRGKGGKKDLDKDKSRPRVFFSDVYKHVLAYYK